MLKYLHTSTPRFAVLGGEEAMVISSLITIGVAGAAGIAGTGLTLTSLSAQHRYNARQKACVNSADEAKSLPPCQETDPSALLVLV